MVDGSDLPFRLLLGGVTHAWTPMYNCVGLLNNPKWAREIMRSIALEKELTNHQVVLQFAASSVEKLRAAYELVRDNEADYVEINFGCAQQIAKSGGYGSYLLDNLPLCFALLEQLRASAPSKKISVKTRLFDQIDEFLDWAARRGASLFTLHGRLKGLKLGCYSGPADYDAVFKAMDALKTAHQGVQFVVNGGIWNETQHARFLQLGADGTMAASYLIANPFLYGVGCSLTSAESPVAQLHMRSEEQILKIVKEVESAPYYAEVMQLIQKHAGGAALESTSYCENPLLKDLPKMQSLSTDLQNRLIKEANAAKPPGVDYIFAPRELKRQILMSSFDLIQNYQFCQQKECEAPWGALLGHVILNCGRDLMNPNPDVRVVLTLKQHACEDYYATRLSHLKVCVVELLRRLDANLRLHVEKEE